MICETKWPRQAEGQILTVTEAVQTTLAVRSFFLIRAAAGNVNGRSREEECGSKNISTSRGYLKPATFLQVTVSSPGAFTVVRIS